MRITVLNYIAAVVLTFKRHSSRIGWRTSAEVTGGQRRLKGHMSGSDVVSTEV